MRDKDYCPEGVILEYVPNVKISYTWEHTDILGFPRTIVIWRLENFDEIKTRVELVHCGFVAAENEMYVGHTGGWSHFLGRLVTYCKSKMK